MRVVGHITLTDHVGVVVAPETRSAEAISNSKPMGLTIGHEAFENGSEKLYNDESIVENDIVLVGRRVHESKCVRRARELQTIMLIFLSQK